MERNCHNCYHTMSLLDTPPDAKVYCMKHKKWMEKTDKCSDYETDEEHYDKK